MSKTKIDFGTLQSSEEFNDILSEKLSDFLFNITDYDIYTIEVVEQTFVEYEEGINWYYTDKGMRLIESWHRRMKKIYDKYFDDNNFKPVSSFYKTF